VTAFTVTRSVSLSATETWARLTDFAAHGDAIPLTRMQTDSAPLGLGWEFSGITGVGRVAFADHMIVTIFDPPTLDSPGRFRIVKIGAWLKGWADVSVTPLPTGGSQVSWTEELGPRLDPVPFLTGPVSAWAGRRLFAQTLDRLLAA
jgi:hypothetical protein